MQYEDSLEYMPPPQDPAPFNKAMRKVTGWNEANTDADYQGMYLRFVWGCDRLEFNSGEFLRRYPDVNNKFIGMPFWILEGWQSPDVLDRKEWEDKADVLGPYPANGHWDFIEVHRAGNYAFRPLSDAVKQKAIRWKVSKEKSRPVVVADILESMTRARQLKEKRWNDFRNKRLGQMMDDIIALDKKGDYPVSTSGHSGITQPDLIPDGYRRTESGILIKGA